MLPARPHLRLALAAAWTLGILAACSIPGRDLPELDVVQIDKLAHAALFAGFGWLWMRALRGPLPARTRWVAGTGLAYAALTELYQGLLPFERSPDPLDALANATGLLMALWAYRLFARKTASGTIW
jgi:hypothetical protein